MDAQKNIINIITPSIIDIKNQNFPVDPYIAQIEQAHTISQQQSLYLQTINNITNKNIENFINESSEQFERQGKKTNEEIREKNKRDRKQRFKNYVDTLKILNAINSDI